MSFLYKSVEVHTSVKAYGLVASLLLSFNEMFMKLRKIRNW